MTTDLDRIIELMPPPHRPADVPRAEHWEHVELHYGVRMPTDFKDFVTEYGDGGVDGFVNVLNPAAGRGMRMDRRGDEMLEIIREIRSFEDIPYPVHPEPRGLLPWADTSNGDTLYWIVDPPEDPDRWRIAVSEVRGPGWLTYPGPITRFLIGILERSLVVDFFPDDFPSPAVAFEPYRALHEPVDPRSWDRQDAEGRGPDASDRLRLDLEALVEEHRRIGSPLPALLRPGLPEAEVREALSSAGVSPQPDLLALYGWSAGVDGTSDGASPRGALVPPQRLMTLDEAVELHRTLAPVIASRAGVVRTHPWLAGRDWFPIMRSDTTVLATIGSGDDAGELRAILEHRAGPSDAPITWTEIWTPYQSLGAAIADFVERMRAGLYRWDHERQAWEESAEALEEFRHTRF